MLECWVFGGRRNDSNHRILTGDTRWSVALALGPVSTTPDCSSGRFSRSHDASPQHPTRSGRGVVVARLALLYGLALLSRL